MKQFPVCVETTGVAVERWYFPPLVSGLCLFFSRRLSLVPRSSFGGWNRRRERTWGSPPHTPGRSMTCTTRKLREAISRMRGDHQRYGGTVMFFPDLSRQVMLCAMSGMSESSESSGSSGSVRAPPASRVITLLQSAWGSPPHSPGRSRTCTSRRPPE